MNNLEQNNDIYISKMDEIKKKLENVRSNSYYSQPLVMTLPGKVLYPEDKRIVSIYPLKGKHEKLMTLNLSPLFFIDNLYAILMDTIKYNDVDELDLKLLSLQDMLTVHFLQKMITYQNDLFTGEIKCSSCGQSFNVTLTAKDIQIDDLVLEDDNFECVLPESQIKVKYTYFKAIDFKEIFNILNNSEQLNDLKQRFNYTPLLAFGVEKIEDTYLSKEEVSSVIDNLTAVDYQFLKTKIEGLFNFGINSVVTKKCPACHSDNTILLSNYGGKNEILPFRLGNVL